MHLLDYEIIRDVVPDAQQSFAAPRGQPLFVVTLFDEAQFQTTKTVIHGRTGMIEDYMHDWRYEDGRIFYYTRGVGPSAPARDLILVYAYGPPPMRFDPQTGRKL